jgi:putative ABC transport system permease protein
MVMIPTESKVWGDMRVLAVKFKNTDLPGMIQKIESRWNDLLEATPISITFLDQQLADLYLEDQQTGSLLALFSVLSIVVAIIGLIGLVSYSVEVRKKEIGIRKVFGASFSQIILMLNLQYMKLILFALIISTPITWWLIGKWLNSFAYKTGIHWMAFVFSGFLILILAFLCVGFLSLRAARLNPAIVLRDE